MPLLFIKSVIRARRLVPPLCPQLRFWPVSPSPGRDDIKQLIPSSLNHRKSRTSRYFPLLLLNGRPLQAYEEMMEILFPMTGMSILGSFNSDALSLKNDLMIDPSRFINVAKKRSSANKNPSTKLFLLSEILVAAMSVFNVFFLKGVSIYPPKSINHLLEDPAAMIVVFFFYSYFGLRRVVQLAFYLGDYFRRCVEQHYQKKTLLTLLKDLMPLDPSLKVDFTPISIYGSSSVSSYWTIQCQKNTRKLLAAELRNAGITAFDQSKEGLILGLCNLRTLSLKTAKTICQNILMNIPKIRHFDLALSRINQLFSNIALHSSLRLTTSLHSNDSEKGAPESLYELAIPPDLVLSDSQRAKLLEALALYFPSAQINISPINPSLIKIKIQDFKTISSLKAEDIKNATAQFKTAIHRELPSLQPDLSSVRRIFSDEEVGRFPKQACHRVVNASIKKQSKPTEQFATRRAEPIGAPATPPTITWNIPGRSTLTYTNVSNHSPHLIALSSSLLPERRLFALWDIPSNSSIPHDVITKAQEIFYRGQIVPKAGAEGFVFKSC